MVRYYEDVASATFRGAEVAFGNWLVFTFVPRGGEVADVSGERVAGDFVVWWRDMRRRFDVKWDRHCHRRRRLPYEFGHECDGGRWLPGWGADESLHFLAFVDAATWHCYVVNRGRLAAFVSERIEMATNASESAWDGEWEREVTPAGWHRFAVRNPDREWTTHGIAVPIRELREAVVIVREVDLEPAEE